MLSTAALLLALTALAEVPAAADPPAVAASSAVSSGNGFDWLLTRAENAFTSDNKIFGEVHLPVIATNPNSGVTYGVLPVWLVQNSHHEITHIFAPMFVYNRIYGAAFEGSYYYYPSGDEKLRIVLNKSERSNYRAAIQYYKRSLLNGRFSFLIDTNYEADGGAQFYGVGPASLRGSEASERLLEDLARVELGMEFWGPFSAAAGWTVRRTVVQEGPFNTPVLLAPKLLTATSYSLPRVTLSRDTRDIAFTPSNGSLAELFAEYSNPSLGGSADYRHYGGQWRFYAPAAENLVTVMHAQSEWSGGGDVPFTALSSLGGAKSLRGYAVGRFQDRGSSFANVEERWRIHSIELVHALTELQVAPFLETGTVYPSPGRAQARYLETVAGVALRVVVKPTVVGKVEVGVGREGPEVFVGIDYPF